MDGGSTFPIVVADSGFGLPSATSTYELISVPIPTALLGQPSVQLRIRSLGLAGGNARLDDFGISGQGNVWLNAFGFSNESSTIVSGVGPAVVDLSMNIVAGVGGLHGIQFDIATHGSSSLSDVRFGSSFPDTTFWELSSNTIGDSTRVVLISQGSGGLPAGSYPSILAIMVDADTVASGVRTDTLILAGTIGSRESDTGDDAFLVQSTTLHQLHVEASVTSFGLSADTVDFSLVETDSIAQSVVYARNLTGNTALSLSSVSSTIAGISAQIIDSVAVPGDSAAILVIADGGVLPLGGFSGSIVIIHSAMTSPDTLAVVGAVGTGSTRGDVNEDGVVDLIDLVVGIDYILGRISLSTELALRIDLFPFPDGDGSADIRDLTVLVRAINRGEWPDGVLLPGSIMASKYHVGETGSIYIQESEEQQTLVLEYDGNLRALQLLVRMSSSIESEDLVPLAGGDLVQTAIHTEASTASVVVYSLDGPISREDRIGLLTLGFRPTDSLISVTGYGVTDDYERVVLEFGESVPRTVGAPTLGQPYPNPFSRARYESVNIPFEATTSLQGALEVVDVLGRTVFVDHDVVFIPGRPIQWNGYGKSGAPVTPGLYLVQIKTETAQASRPIIIGR